MLPLKYGNCDCEDSYTAGSKRQAIFVLLIWVQHAQGHCQLAFTVRYNGKGQRAASRLLTVVCQDILVSTETQALSKLFKPNWCYTDGALLSLINIYRL